MANPEIDEAAAVEWAGVVLWSETAMAEDKNLALAALAWKARAENLAASREAAEAERDSLKRQLPQAVKAR